MKRNLGVKPFLYPMPVLIVATYNDDDTANAMTVAWGSIADYDKIAIYVAKEHKTAKNILNKRAFTVSIADDLHVVDADYVGIVSANKEHNKLIKTGFSTVKSEFVNAPVIKELAMVLECELVSFDEKAELVIGKIVNLAVDESILTKENKIDLSKFSPIIYDPVNHTYMNLGKVVGKAFKDGAKLK